MAQPRASDRVSVHLGDAHEVVIVEGRGLVETDDAELARMVAAVQPEVRLGLAARTTGSPILAVVPEVVLAWTAAPTEEAQTAPFPLAAGKWVVRGAD